MIHDIHDIHHDLHHDIHHGIHRDIHHDTHDLRAQIEFLKCLTFMRSTPTVPGTPEFSDKRTFNFSSSQRRKPRSSLLGVHSKKKTHEETNSPWCWLNKDCCWLYWITWFLETILKWSHFEDSVLVLFKWVVVPPSPVLQIAWKHVSWICQFISWKYELNPIHRLVNKADGPG